MQLTSLKEGQWVRIVVPFKFTDVKYDPTKDYENSIRIEMSAGPKVAGARYEFAAPKLEKGSAATDFSVNPEDTATVTALSQLSQTVDGMKLDISKKIEQKDLNGYATQTWAQNQINATADGINATLSSVKTTVDGHDTSINELKADSSGFKSQFTTVNNTLGKQSTDIGTLQATSKSLSANFDSLNSDNKTNKHNISQLQASATEFNSTLMTVQQRVTDSAVGTNLYTDTQNFDNLASWNTAGSAPSTYWTKTTDTYNGLAVIQTTANWNGLSQYIQVKKGDFLTYSAYVKNTSGTGSSTVYWLLNNNPEGSYSTARANPAKNVVTITNSWQRISVTTVATSDGYLRPRLERTPDNVNTIQIAGIKVEKGSVATDWCPNPADNATVTALSQLSQTIDSVQTTVRGKVDNETYQSKITQLNDLIDLRVENAGVINAINITPERIKIRGNKLHITADTYIDNAVIKDAMIANLSADKLTAGTIDAANINVINLNANNITTGTINGSNLSINLNTGNVQFQAGRIHSADNAIDINIDSGYMSVANGSNRVMLKDGEMQFVQPGTYDTSTDPYLSISNTFGGQSTEGAAFIGRKYAVLTNSDNATGSGIFDIGIGTEKFSGFATGYGSGLLNKGWHMTKVGGADRGVVISGGKATSYNQYWSASPSIMVGATHTSTHSGGMNGSNIIMDCNYLYNFSTWVKTTSHAANVYVADDGAIVRASSASKYKTNIERSFETEMGERILEVPTAHWFDKAEVLNKTLDPQAPDPRRYFGMIADDVDDAGLTELVEYNDRGEVEGLMYDRITLTLIPIIRNYRDRINKLESEIKQLKEG
ncbi:MULTISPECIES: gp58-like family protein [Lactiplantibacillus]|uniref:gp58-like family protein n=1 Tax=Lactiplantibacillus TaxID=2767842 RepID=UPI001C1FC53C|nr:MULTISPECIES: gp58-like family protein [Lactiplantibacillus]MBU7449346.1 hypothetical protein [Lactiplantibacillus sp. 7.2.4]MBU7481720.1 hypothetical protein [Lactiplantibacillus pentosus]